VLINVLIDCKQHVWGCAGHDIFVFDWIIQKVI